MKDVKAICRSACEGRYEEFLAAGYRTYFSRRPPNGVKLPDQDWDMLIVLDACRYDVFRDVNWLPGTLRKETSRGSSSIDSLNRNYTEYYDDIVYVSANPHVADMKTHHYGRTAFHGSDHFHHVVETYLDNDPMDAAATRKAAVAACERFPNKRIAVHFMPPHAPYRGDFTLADEDVDLKDLHHRGFSREEILKAYRSNLRYGLQEAETLIQETDRSNVVITADHGEAFGEYGLWGHPAQVYIKPLIEVPWLEVRNQ